MGSSVSDIRRLLSEHVTAPVRFLDCVEQVLDMCQHASPSTSPTSTTQDVTFLELGSTAVCAPLIKQIHAKRLDDAAVAPTGGDRAIKM